MHGGCRTRLAGRYAWWLQNKFIGIGFDGCKTSLVAGEHEVLKQVYYSRVAPKVTDDFLLTLQCGFLGGYSLPQPVPPRVWGFASHYRSALHLHGSLWLVGHYLLCISLPITHVNACGPTLIRNIVPDYTVVNTFFVQVLDRKVYCLFKAN